MTWSCLFFTPPKYLTRVMFISNNEYAMENFSFQKYLTQVKSNDYLIKVLTKHKMHHRFSPLLSILSVRYQPSKFEGYISVHKAKDKLSNKIKHNVVT